jgi:hypothetical protein
MFRWLGQGGSEWIVIFDQNIEQDTALPQVSSDTQLSPQHKTKNRFMRN